MKTYSLKLIVEQTGLEEDQIVFFIEQQIIQPFDISEKLFDEEDLARLFLIKDLMEQCNPNSESLEVILHLIDQLHVLQSRLR
jgi:DNA-binding transcriptional MerR regulator